MSQPSLLPTVTLVDGTPRVSSLDIAKRFNKTHKDVLRIVGELEANFNERNFAPVDYTDAKGESRPAYSLTRDAFVLVVMGFTGKAALTWKVRYIEAFNAMEARLTGQPVPVNMPAGSQKVAPPKPYCTDREMKPLDDAVNTWVKTGKLTRLEALAKLRTEFGVTRYGRFWPVELIEPAIEWVRAQSRTPQKKIPDTTVLFDDIRKAEEALRPVENWTHLSVRWELRRKADPCAEEAVNMHVNAAWHALGLARSSLLAALAVGKIA